jgi:hypothetical protein
MVFKKLYFFFTGLIFTGFTVFFFIGCSDTEKINTDNTFYIELANFSTDSLKQNIGNNIFGKAAFYKNDKLEILSINYLTEDYPKIRYYKNAEELKENIKPNTKKIRIESEGEFLYDSIKYALQKFIYTDNHWVKTSDMGVLKETKKFVQPQNILDEFVRVIVLNTVEYSFN